MREWQMEWQTTQIMLGFNKKPDYNNFQCGLAFINIPRKWEIYSQVLENLTDFEKIVMGPVHVFSPKCDTGKSLNHTYFFILP